MLTMLGGKITGNSVVFTWRVSLQVLQISKKDLLQCSDSCRIKVTLHFDYIVKARPGKYRSLLI